MYNYEAQKEELFTEEGFEILLKITDNTRMLIKTAGAFSSAAAMKGCTGDGWTMLAALDYLVEKKCIEELTAGQNVAGQSRIYTEGLR